MKIYRKAERGLDPNIFFEIEALVTGMGLVKSVRITKQEFEDNTEIGTFISTEGRSVYVINSACIYATDYYFFLAGGEQTPTHFYEMGDVRYYANDMLAIAECVRNFKCKDVVDYTLNGALLTVQVY